MEQKIITLLENKLFNSFNFTRVERGKLNSIKKRSNNVEIEFTDIPSLSFTLTYLLKNKDKDFDEQIANKFNSNGLMLDCSRNGVVKVEVVKDFIKYSARLGFNRLYLYIEDTYEIKEEPYFGYLRGSYTKEEMNEIADFAEVYEIDIVPCIQTLSHLKTLLRWRPYWFIKDGNRTLLVGADKTYELIERMIQSITEGFRCKYIHLGMDEAFEMGRNEYINQYGYENFRSIFEKHIKKVLTIVKKYNLIPYIWGDMYFILIDGMHYDPNKEIDPKIAKQIPEEVKLVYWDYYSDAEEVYSNRIKQFSKLTKYLAFAGGAWRWVGFAPSIEASLRKSDAALKAVLKSDVKEVFVTAWGDNGNECSAMSSLPIMVQYSLFQHFGEASREEISEYLSIICGENLDRMLLLDLPNREDEKLHGSAHNACKYFFYQDVLLGLFDSFAKDEYALNYEKFANQLENAAKESEQFGYVYNNLAKLCKCLSIKVNLGLNIRKFYKNNDRKSLVEISLPNIDKCLMSVKDFNDTLREQWLKENKPFGFEVLSGRIGFLKNRLEDAKRELKQYLNGELKVIEELEKDILPFDNASLDEDLVFNLWDQTVTVNNI